MSQRFPNKKITIILPAYKAEKTLAQTIAAIPKDCIDEMILVDDASPDRTVEVAQALGIDVVIRHPKNRGYGGNQKTCYQTALARGADIVVMVHPDYQYDPVFIPQFCEPLVRDEADAVFGSRMLIPKNALKGGMPYWKFLANIVLTFIENAVLGLRLSEYHSGFRAYSRKTLMTVPFMLCPDDFVFDSEIIVQMRTANLKIQEIPISTRYFPEASSISFRRSCQYGFAILKVLAQYVLFRFNLFSYEKFISFTAIFSSCPVCQSQAPQMDYGPQKGIHKSEKSYTITERSQGLTQTLFYCQNCDLVFTTDRTDPSAVQTLYEEQGLDHAYLAGEVGRRKTARVLLQRLLLLLPKKGVLVDVGSGYGFFLDEAKKAGWQTHGIELGTASATYARGYGLAITQASWHALSTYPDASIDAITALDILEHLDDPDGFLKLAAAKLKPDGCLLITAPNRSSFFAKLTGKRWHAYLPSHLSYFSTRAMQLILERHGLSIAVSRSYGRYFSLEYVLTRACEYGISERIVKIVGPLVRPLIVPINLGDEFELYIQKKTTSVPKQ